MQNVDRAKQKAERRSALRSHIISGINIHFGSNDNPSELYQEAMEVIDEAVAKAQDFADERMIQPNGRWRWTTKQS